MVIRTARTDARLDSWLADEYGLAGALSPLGGEGTNALLTTADSRRFVVKLADEDSPPESIALEHAASVSPRYRVARCGSGSSSPFSQWPWAVAREAHCAKM